MVVSDINPILNDLCSPTQNIQIAEISSKPPKRPEFRIDGRQRQSSIFNIDYESLPITNFFWNWIYILLFAATLYRVSHLKLW